MKNQGVKEFYMLARIGSYCKIMVFSPFKVQVTYYHSSKGKNDGAPSNLQKPLNALYKWV